MSAIVNLRQFRKRKEKAAKADTAEQNRAKYGRTKAEKARDNAVEAKRTSDLDSKKLDTEGG